MFWKDGLSKKNRARIWSFLYYQERWYFFFPKISSYSLDTKWNMIFLKKISGNIFSSNVLKRWSFQKICAWTWSFFKYLERWYFFFPENMIKGVTGVTLPSSLKKTKMPGKNTPKGIISDITETDDIHPRFILDSSYFCWNATFIGNLEMAQEAATGDVLQEKAFLGISQNSQRKTERPVPEPLF